MSDSNPVALAVLQAAMSKPSGSNGNAPDPVLAGHPLEAAAEEIMDALERKDKGALARTLGAMVKHASSLED